MSIVVTGATGSLGTLVIKELLERTPASQIAAVARDATKAQHLAEQGIEVRIADYGKPETLASAFAPGDTVLLISGSEVGQRVPQHKAVIDAAAAAGASRLVYTSILGGPRASFLLADEHKQTEQLIEESGLEHTILRNGWYTENYTAQIPVQRQHGVLGSAGDGRIAAAPRADYAAAAAVVLTTEGHGSAAYELNGDTSFALAEYADELARQTGEDIAYVEVSPAEHEDILAGAGVPAAMAHILADVDIAIRQGQLASHGNDLSRLIGRPTTPVSDAIAAALR
ncbi:NAD(P)H-binding protein [Lolliginicoccus suaedae]|uniref:NAD(P)H-binding protein n=1 Tax=Lolliginicoccus suaedae TaxID=2605429 RepID=UPI0011ED183F|nr:NAD(P)H-binding protein [Lolliginicoccus suaedae]